MPKNPFESPTPEYVSSHSEKPEDTAMHFEELLAKSAQVEIKTQTGVGVKDYSEALDTVMLEVLKNQGIAGKDETLPHKEIVDIFYKSYFSLITINEAIKTSSQYFSREISEQPRLNISTGKEIPITESTYRSFETERGDFQNAADILLLTMARDRLREVGVTDVYGDPKDDVTRKITQENYMAIRDAVMTNPSTPRFIQDHIRKLETPKIFENKVVATELIKSEKDEQAFPEFPQSFDEAQVFFHYLQSHSNKQSSESSFLGSKKSEHPQKSSLWIFETSNGNYKVDRGYNSDGVVTRIRISTIDEAGKPSRPKEFLKQA